MPYAQLCLPPRARAAQATAAGVAPRAPVCEASAAGSGVRQRLPWMPESSAWLHALQLWAQNAVAFVGRARTGNQEHRRSSFCRKQTQRYRRGRDTIRDYGPPIHFSPCIERKREKYSSLSLRSISLRERDTSLSLRKRERSILQRLRAASPGRHFVLCMVSGAQMAAAAQSLP